MNVVLILRFVFSKWKTSSTELVSQEVGNLFIYSNKFVYTGCTGQKEYKYMHSFLS